MHRWMYEDANYPSLGCWVALPVKALFYGVNGPQLSCSDAGSGWQLCRTMCDWCQGCPDMEYSA